MNARRPPSYLRVVLTTRCNYQCSFCHMEGDPQVPGAPTELPLGVLAACLRAAALAGVQKFKFLGGEPLLRRDFPVLLASLRALAPEADLSLITAGAVPTERLDAAYDAGLTRANVSLHGWSPEALARNLPSRRGWELRQRFLEAALEHSSRRRVPLKLNYVWSRGGDREDLRSLLAWAAEKPVVVGLLDELSEGSSWLGLAALLRELRGPWQQELAVDDAHSLPTRELRWSDGLRVELKDHQVGALAPLRACEQCPARPRCTEGILALRLTHHGMLRPCLSRGDLDLPLAEYVAANGPELGAILWRRYAEAL